MVGNWAGEQSGEYLAQQGVDLLTGAPATASAPAFSPPLVNPATVSTPATAYPATEAMMSGTDLLASAPSMSSWGSTGASTGALGAQAATDAATWGAQSADAYNTISGLYEGSAGLYGTPAAGGMGEMVSQYLPYVGAALGTYGAYDLFTNDRTSGRTGTGTTMAQGAASGAAIGGAMMPGWGHLIGGIIGGLGGAIHNMTGSRKGKEQLMRDSVRSKFKEAGLVDDKYIMTLDNGRQLDLGKDGSWAPYNVDTNKASAQQGVGWLQPLAYMIAGGNDKMADQFAGILYNELDPTGDMDLMQLRDEVLYVYKKFGVKPSQLAQFANESVEDTELRKLDPARRDAFLAALESLKVGGGLQDLSVPKPSAPAAPPVAGEMPQPQSSAQSQAQATMEEVVGALGTGGTGPRPNVPNVTPNVSQLPAGLGGAQQPRPNPRPSAIPANSPFAKDEDKQAKPNQKKSFQSIFGVSR